MSTTPPTSPETFTLFPLLPLEIRRMIWDIIFEPRVVYLQDHLFKLALRRSIHSNAAVDREDFAHPARGYQSSPRIPATVCRESLAIVSERRTKAFGTEFIPPNTWFDFQRDILYLCGCDPCHGGGEYQAKLLSSETTRVERLAVFNPFSEYLSTHIRWPRRVLEAFPNVKHLMIVDKQHGQQESDVVMMDGVLNIQKAIATLLETEVIEPSVEDKLEKLQQERRRILEYCRSPQTMNLIKNIFLESRPSDMPLIERRTFTTRENE